MSRRDAGAAGHQARHARARLHAALGDGRGLLHEGDGEFIFRGPEEADPAGREGEVPAGGGAAGESTASTEVGPALRWRLGLRVAILLGILAVAAGAMFWWQTASGRAEILPLGADSTAESPEPSGTAASQADPSAGSLVAHVAGAVANPGVVHLPEGSRVHEAIAAAGGGTPDADLNRLNLALVVEDAQKIYVPRQGEAVPSGPDAAGMPDAAGSAGGAGAAVPKININTAGPAELDALPKVGPVLAQRIVDWRTEHGAFKAVEELDAVDGVGPKMLEALLPLVTV